MGRSWKAAATAVCALVALGATGTAAQAGGGDGSFSTTTVTAATRSTLSVTLDADPAGRPRTLSQGAAKAPAVLRCDRNPSWSDARGTLHARFNCHHSTINWGYQISPKVRAVITGKVHETGVSWWRNGTRHPKNAGHVVGAGYLFHGTLKPVTHGDHVQFQDHMTFRVNIGGRTGTGSLTWAADVKAKK